MGAQKQNSSPKVKKFQSPLFLFLIGKLHTRPMGLESTATPFTRNLYVEVPIELELIDKIK